MALKIEERDNKPKNIAVFRTEKAKTRILLYNLQKRVLKAIESVLICYSNSRNLLVI